MIDVTGFDLCSIRLWLNHMFLYIITSNTSENVGIGAQLATGGLPDLTGEPDEGRLGSRVRNVSCIQRAAMADRGAENGESMRHLRGHHRGERSRHEPGAP